MKRGLILIMKENQSYNSNHNDHSNNCDNAMKADNCEVKAKGQIPLADALTPLVLGPTRLTAFKVPVILAEREIQVVVESDISLSPPATEIKRVKKHVFLDQVKLVPVRFTRVANTDFFFVTRAKLFVSGHIRKNIEYASKECNGPLQDRIANVPFSGFAELTAGDFITPPIMGISEAAEANFLNDKTELDARLDKYFFQNLVKYNEQPYGELVAANFFELDFSPTSKYRDGSFSTLREKIVLDLHLKLLQVQQVFVNATSQAIVPNLPGLTPPAGEPGAPGTDFPLPEE